MDSVGSMDSVAGLRSRLREFAVARDWEQYHTPRNLAMALSGEAGELIAELQWLDDDGTTAGLGEGPLKERLGDEAADVLIYLVRLADVCGIDLIECANAKKEPASAFHQGQRQRRTESPNVRLQSSLRAVAN